jgi:hypothetical protein
MDVSQLYPENGEDNVLGYDGLVILDFASKADYEAFSSSADYKEKTSIDGPRCTYKILFFP